MAFNQADKNIPCAKIKVIGVGGGGTNAVNTMIKSEIEGVEFLAANTDIQSLSSSLAPTKIQIGKELTKGLGAGADPDVGRDAALEDRSELQQSLVDSDMIFVTAGMGGGTGTGGASVVSQIARDSGALTVGVVTTPFNFEGKRRQKHAALGSAKLREQVDTLIVIPNERLLQVATPGMSLLDAFKLADTVLVNAVKGISDIINVPGTINVDFADVKAVMSNMGHALMGIGSASGEDRAIDAATQAISSPLLNDVDIEGATGILINITASEEVSLLEINEACSVVQEAAHENANIIFGAVIDSSMEDNLRVSVIATGFPMDVEAETESSVQSRRKASQTTRRTPLQKREFSNHNKNSHLYPPTPHETNRQTSDKEVLNHTKEEEEVLPQQEELTRAKQGFVKETTPPLPAQTTAQQDFVKTSNLASKSDIEELAQWTLELNKQEKYPAAEIEERWSERDTSSFEEGPSTAKQELKAEEKSYSYKQDLCLDAERSEKFYTPEKDELEITPSPKKPEENIPAEHKESKTQETHPLESEAKKNLEDQSISDEMSSLLSFDIEEKIDEALKTVKNSSELRQSDEHLDIPTFMRTHESPNQESTVFPPKHS